MAKSLRWLTDVSESEAIQLQVITSSICSEEALKDVETFSFSLAFIELRKQNVINGRIFVERLTKEMSEAGDRQRIGLWILMQWLRDEHCTLDEACFLIDAFMQAEHDKSSIFFAYEVVKTIFRSDRTYGRRCLETLLADDCARPRDGYDMASDQLAEVLRQVAADDPSEASEIAGFIRDKRDRSMGVDLYFLGPYLAF